MEDEATVKLKISNLKSYLKLNGKAMFGEGTTAYCEIEKGYCKIKYSHEEEVPGGPDESTCDLLNIPPPPVCVATGSPNCTPYLNYGSPALHQGHPGYISEIYWHMMASQQGYDFVFQEEAAEYTRQHFVETHAEQAFVVGVEISSMRSGRGLSRRRTTMAAVEKERWICCLPASFEEQQSLYDAMYHVFHKEGTLMTSDQQIFMPDSEERRHMAAKRGILNNFERGVLDSKQLLCPGEARKRFANWIKTKPDGVDSWCADVSQNQILDRSGQYFSSWTQSSQVYSVTSDHWYTVQEKSFPWACQWSK